MAGREQVLSLLSSAINHGDVVVKLSFLRQAKDILLSLDPSSAAELFPYLVDFQSSSQVLVRKFLAELIDELGPKVIEKSSVLLPVLLTLLKDDAPVVVRQSIVSGIKVFCCCLEEMALQFHQSGKVERWLKELWMWMIKLKDSIFGISLEPGSVGAKLLAVKFLEMYVILFTSDANDRDVSLGEGKRRTINISWVVKGHRILDPSLLTVEANKTIGLLLDMLQSDNTLCGSQIIAIINCLAAIGRKRPLHFSNIVSALLNFDPNFETTPRLDRAERAALICSHCHKSGHDITTCFDLRGTPD